MDLGRAILKEHTRAQATKIADYVGNNRALFKQLVDIYLAGPYRITQRAAWPLSICVERYPALAGPELKRLLDFLGTPGVHDAVKRNTIRLLQYINIPARHVGKVAKICFGYLMDKREPVAVRVFSMTVLSNVVRSEPDLRRELRIIIEDQLPYSSAAFVSRGRKVLKELTQQPD